jgi:hypothetical protein
VQGLCLPFRGFSRSGATISAGAWRYFGYYCLAAAVGVGVVWQLTG